MVALNSLYEKHIPFYHASWLQVFQLFQFSFFQEEKVNYHEVHAMFQDIEHRLQKVFYITIFTVAFYIIFIKLRCVFNPLKTIHLQLLWHCQLIKSIYVPVLKTWWFFIFIIMFQVFIINFGVSVNNMTYFTSDIFFSINNISISVSRSNFTLVFLRLLAMLILLWKENEKDQAHIFQETYF